ncbi:ATP synthase subunit I [Spirulina subsalsa]|uniref:ATP synthase subunit I n=1 Tax=Spirulina subsalsa TaxID=54311 RepID=UPI001ED99A55|nr:ATP synthase subunit I [Spirulina subsalsa]
MNSPEPSLKPTSSVEDTSTEASTHENSTHENSTHENLTASAGDSMEEYYKLQNALYLVTLGLTAFIFVCVWIAYSLNTGLNYLIGACVGVVYLRMLAKDVEKIGGQKRKLGINRLAPVIGVLLVATQLDQFQIVPIFLGFMTYKAAIVVYVLQTTLLPAQR